MLSVGGLPAVDIKLKYTPVSTKRIRQEGGAHTHIVVSLGSKCLMLFVLVCTVLQICNICAAE